MTVKRIWSEKRKAYRYCFRFMCPLKRRLAEWSSWASTRAAAEELYRKEMDDRRRKRAGLPTSEGWALDWAELIERFLDEAPISSTDRKWDLRQVLEKNELNIKVAADLNDVGTLTARAKRLLETGECTSVYLVGKLQPVMRQMTRWAHEAGALPENPLTRWRKLPFTVERSKRRSYRPEEVQAILSAARELDKTYERKYPSELVLRTLVTSGNRPGAMCAASVAKLESDRVRLAAGKGKKRNGAATLPPELIAELRLYCRKRSGSTPLLVSSTGAKIDLVNFNKDCFRPAATLAFVKLNWPADDPDTRFAEPLEVASIIHRKTGWKFDGAPATDSEKLALRERQKAAIDALAEKLRPVVLAKLEGRDLYAFCRKTHETLARAAGIHPDAVNAQLGHVAPGTGERFYLDESLLDPAQSSSKVYALIKPATEQQAAPKSEPLQKAAGAENQDFSEAVTESVSRGRAISKPKTKKQNAQPVDEQASCIGATSRTRTGDLRFTKAFAKSSTINDFERIKSENARQSEKASANVIPFSATNQRSHCGKQSASIPPELQTLLESWATLPARARKQIQSVIKTAKSKGS